MVKDDYYHIWDCCCDHGFLGASLLSNQKAKNIHFVDIVPELMSDIENKLQQFYSKSSSYKLGGIHANYQVDRDPADG